MSSKKRPQVLKIKKKEKPEEPYPELSIVMVCCNGMPFTYWTVETLRKNTASSWELICIDNATNDGTTEWLKAQKDIVYIRSDELLCYGSGMNLGLKKAHLKSKYLSIINNDLWFTPGWDQYLINGLDPDKFKPLTGLPKVGISGPMSNHVGGFQLDRNFAGQYTKETLDQLSIKRAEMILKNSKEPPIIRVGFLSGFCWIMTRECYEAVGDLEEFKPLGFEDNDYVWRADLKGFASVMVTPSFVHHDGGKTTDYMLDQKYAKRGMINRFPYYQKWLAISRMDPTNVARAEDFDPSNKRKKKLIAGYRVKNVGRWFKRVLTKMSEVADEIVIFNDHSTDDTLEIAKTFEKVVKIHDSNETTFNEARDRQKLLDLCYERNPDWLIITDGDEILEDCFTREVADRLMNPIKPNISAYVFRYVTLWDSEDKQRTDGIFGGMSNYRMFRYLKSSPSIPNNHPQGLHCNSIPVFPPDMCQIVPYRIFHHGYIDEEMRYQKYNWYEKNDTKKEFNAIGADNYRHLIEPKPTLIPVTKRNTLSCAMIVKNEEDHIEQFLDDYHSYFHEIVIVDTGSTDKTLDKIKFYQQYGNIKLYEYPWNEDFSAARNFAIEQCTSDWIFILDADERLGKEPYLVIQMYYRLIEEPTIAYTVTFLNYLPMKRGDREQKAFPSQNMRLFRNNLGIHYKGGVHEGVELSVKEIQPKTKYGIPVRLEEKMFALDHYGYLKSDAVVEKKLEKYSKILHKMLKKEPKNAMAHFSLGLHYEALGDYDKAEYHYQQAMEYQPELLHTYREWGNLLMRRAKKITEKGIKYANPETMFGKAMIERMKMFDRFIPDMPKVGIPPRDAV